MHRDPGFPTFGATPERIPEERKAAARKELVSKLGLADGADTAAILKKFDTGEDAHDEHERGRTAWGPAEQGEFFQTFGDPDAVAELIEELREEGS